MQQQEKRDTKSHEIPVAIIGLIGTFFGALAVVVVALIGRSAGVVNISTTNAQPTPVVSTVMQTEAPAPASTVTVTETASAPGAPPLPEGVEMRRSTGNNPITLRSGFSVDLDDAVGPNWSLDEEYQDLRFYSGEPSYVRLSGARLASETKRPDYATCAVETAYSDQDALREKIKKGGHFCVTTSDKRVAAITIIAISNDAVTFSAEVWDPPLDE
jgi:hypothetical protein